MQQCGCRNTQISRASAFVVVSLFCAHECAFVLVKRAPLFVPILITATDNPIVTVLQQPTVIAAWRR